MRGKIPFFATILALTAILSVSCRMLPLGTAEVAAEVVVEVEAEHTAAEPVPEPEAAPAPTAEPVPEPAPEIEPQEQLPESGSEPAPPSDPAPAPSPVPEPTPTPLYQTGQKGPNGGIVFSCEGKYLETGVPYYFAPSFWGAEAYCAEISQDRKVSYRLPTVAELHAIYNELVITDILDVELTYYWSGNQQDSISAIVINFDTGFIGTFYLNNDFVNVLPVTELP